MKTPDNEYRALMEIASAAEYLVRAIGDHSLDPDNGEENAEFHYKKTLLEIAFCNFAEMELAPAHIDTLHLSTRASNCLRHSDSTQPPITTVRQLMRVSKNDLLKRRNLGRKTLQEIIDALARDGITLMED